MNGAGQLGTTVSACAGGGSPSIPTDKLAREQTSEMDLPPRSGISRIVGAALASRAERKFPSSGILRIPWLRLTPPQKIMPRTTAQVRDRPGNRPAFVSEFLGGQVAEGAVRSGAAGVATAESAAVRTSAEATRFSCVILSQERRESEWTV